MRAAGASNKKRRDGEAGAPSLPPPPRSGVVPASSAAGANRQGLDLVSRLGLQARDGPVVVWRRKAQTASGRRHGCTAMRLPKAMERGLRGRFPLENAEGSRRSLEKSASQSTVESVSGRSGGSSEHNAGEQHASGMAAAAGAGTRMPSRCRSQGNPTDRKAAYRGCAGREGSVAAGGASSREPGASSFAPPTRSRALSLPQMLLDLKIGLS